MKRERILPARELFSEAFLAIDLIKLFEARSRFCGNRP